MKLHTPGLTPASASETPSRPRTSVARELISQMIIRLELRPGERLLESELQRRTGLGRTPIREALFQLVQEGLVVKDARGFVVSELSEEEIGQLYEVREALEALAVQRTVARARDEELHQFAEAFTAAHSGGTTPEERLLIGWRFHRELARLSGSVVLEEFLERVLRRIERVRFMEILSDPSGRRAREEHARILEAVMQRKAEEAEAELRAHIRRSRERVLELFAVKWQLVRC
jgi:DNA-binding GntR family transcriptional regulator